MAIHVLTDIAGQEVELLAFDCFEKGPHYHYGPRNQDVRIYWDVTTSGETLRWTLDQFKAGKIRSMIQRAGYPTVAANVDEELVQATLPQIEARSWELVAQNKGSQTDPKAELMKRDRGSQGEGGCSVAPSLQHRTGLTFETAPPGEFPDGTKRPRNFGASCCYLIAGIQDCSHPVDFPPHGVLDSRLHHRVPAAYA